MTRINSNLDPRVLKRAHLIAEWREITMVPAALRRSLRTRYVSRILESIPHKFTLNRGHVSFFYNKLGFLRNRMELLADEMERRGYTPDRTRLSAFDGFDEVWMGDWQPSLEDTALIQERIAKRIAEKPHLYKD